LLFDVHVDKVVNEAYRNLGLIIRMEKDFRKTETLMRLFQTYVRSKIEYATIIWNPSTANNSDKLEKI